MKKVKLSAWFCTLFIIRKRKLFGYRIVNTSMDILVLEDWDMEESGRNIANVLSELLNAACFNMEKILAKEEWKTIEKQSCILQAMMLLDRNYVPGFVLKDFSETSVVEYLECMQGNCAAKQRNLILSAIQYLVAAFPQKNERLTDIEIPMLLFLADVAEDAGIEPVCFCKWWDCFRQEEELFETYKEFCTGDAWMLKQVNGRLAIMLKSFCLYNEMEISEKWQEMIAEVESDIAWRNKKF